MLDGVVERLLGNPENRQGHVLRQSQLINGDFDLISDSIFADGSLVWRVEILTDAYGTLDVLRLRVAEVPVPASIWLLGSGLICLLGGARRARRASGHREAARLSDTDVDLRAH